MPGTLTNPKLLALGLALVALLVTSGVAGGGNVAVRVALPLGVCLDSGSGLGQPKLGEVFH